MRGKVSDMLDAGFLKLMCGRIDMEDSCIHMPFSICPGNTWIHALSMEEDDLLVWDMLVIHASV